MEETSSEVRHEGQTDQGTHLAWQMLLDEIDEAVLWIEPSSGVIIDSNRSAERLLGLQRTALFGRTLNSFISSHLPPGTCSRQDHPFDDTISMVEMRKANGLIFQADCHRVRAGALDAFLVRDVSCCYNLEQAFIDSEQKYQGLVTRSPVGIILINENGMLVEWNQYMESLTGMEAGAVLGRYLWDVQYDLLTPALKADTNRQALEKTVRRLMEEGKPAHLHRVESAPLQRVDGEVRMVEMIQYPLRTSRGYWVGAVMIDLTERLRAEEEARRQAIRSQALARSAARLQGQGDLEPLLKDFCEEISEQLDMPVVSVFLASESERALRLAATSGLSNESIHLFEAVGYEQYERRLNEAGDVWVIDDIQRTSGLPNERLFRRENIRTVVVIILHQEDVVLGALSVCSKGKPVAVSEDQVSLLRAFADLASVAVQRQHYLHQVLEASSRLRAMSRRLIEVQEKESRRIARELHDEIGQNLTFLKIMLEMLPENLSPEMKQKGASSKEIVNTLIGQIRALAMDLRPSLLDDLGLVHALLAYFERMELSTGIHVEFSHSRTLRRYSSEIETTVYRVVQEALSNVARHAKVKEAWVRIWESQGDLYFQIEDTGAGFAFQPDLYHRSFGLLGMRERVELCNGNLEIDSEPGQGTRITAWIPLNNDNFGSKCYDDLNNPR